MTAPQLTLPAEVASVPAARRFVRQVLEDLGAAGACDDAEALVSELATNAVLHARTPFTIEVSREGQQIRICVLDLSPAVPKVRDYGPSVTTGRGMRLVTSLAADWGVERQGAGKTVWFELPASGVLHPSASGADVVDVDSLLATFADPEDDAPPRARALAA